jgi:hypothetical protein
MMDKVGGWWEKESVSEKLYNFPVIILGNIWIIWFLQDVLELKIRKLMLLIYNSILFQYKNIKSPYILRALNLL